MAIIQSATKTKATRVGRTEGQRRQRHRVRAPQIDLVAEGKLILARRESWERGTE